MADDGVSVDELWTHSKTIFAFARQIRRDAGPTAVLDAEGLEKAAKLMEQAEARQDGRIAVDISNDNSSSQPACCCSSREWVSVPLATEGPLRTAAAPTANELCGPVAPSGACTVECAYLPASVPASVTVQERQPPADAEVTSAAALRSQHASVAVPGVVTCPNRLTGSCRKSDTETNSAALVI